MKEATKIVKSGRNTAKQNGCVNPPIIHSSTVIYPDLESFESAESGTNHYNSREEGDTPDITYGIGGSDTHFALQDALKEIEGKDADHCLLTPSGLNAITVTLMALCKAGDHILLTDNIYGPTRRFAEHYLKRNNIEVSYYSVDETSIKPHLKENTKLVFLESPGSLTFEIQDIDKLVKEAKNANCITIFDNSWATPLFFKPLEHGIDISINAITKYAGGHSDILMGAILFGPKHKKALFRMYQILGQSVSAYDCSLALRGLRSMNARLKQHQDSALKLAKYFESESAIAEIHFPALESDKYHELYKKYFTGFTSLFAITLKAKYDTKTLSNAIKKQNIFSVGASWGGFESLIIAFNPKPMRKSWKHEGTSLRFYVGLEDAEDILDAAKTILGELK